MTAHESNAPPTPKTEMGEKFDFFIKPFIKATVIILCRTNNNYFIFYIFSYIFYLCILIEATTKGRCIRVEMHHTKSEQISQCIFPPRDQASVICSYGKFFCKIIFHASFAVMEVEMNGEHQHKQGR